MLCSLDSSKLLKSLFLIWLVLHDVPARAFLYQVFGKVGDFVVLFHQRSYGLSGRIDFLESLLNFSLYPFDCVCAKIFHLNLLEGC